MAAQLNGTNKDTSPQQLHRNIHRPVDNCGAGADAGGRGGEGDAQGCEKQGEKRRFPVLFEATGTGCPAIWLFQ
ncbi:hypothetical protein XAC3810_1280027 [Xanthomonas citri pv. citri]|uniref:Uncharacterized protein n=1 Tax=Xanthomonas citri pv. citri TaxID=611301 RepID=A0A0U5FA37_XANCI|nr:hypothetical protein XAC3810_1280027 [Xanthomonas citri pv. citri]CEE29281.1 hypothetical protein XAC2911_1520012 [Xanthomonas citri pv. citri]CEE55461.1 hypothetical protein XACW160_1470025 [Xanthomonas citri pv. citri]CEE56489.1 hypothetical protein XAC2852_1270008 [Xanthomonas citri pv. citri]CEE80171.1 hypothetical protein XACLE20_1940026 [Xanthomonas citri pv. citri]